MCYACFIHEKQLPKKEKSLFYDNWLKKKKKKMDFGVYGNNNNDDEISQSFIGINAI